MEVSGASAKVAAGFSLRSPGGGRAIPRSLKAAATKSIGSKGKLGLWPLIMAIFFCVSGGPYGLETVVHSGRGIALLLIVLVPLIWAMPIAPPQTSEIEPELVQKILDR